MKLTQHWSNIILVAGFVCCVALSAPALADTYSDAVLGDNPLGYWRMDGSGVNQGSDGTTLQHSDVSVNTEAAGPGGESYPGFDGGNSAVYYNGSALDTGFSRVGDAIEPDSYAYDITGAMTVEAWVKADDLDTGNRAIVANFHNTNGHRSYMLYQNGSGLRFSVSGDGSSSNLATAVTSGSLTTDEWYHVVGVFRPSESVELYVNGELASSVTSGVPDSAFVSKYATYIGAQWTNKNVGSWFLGSIDEVAIYDSALSDTQIKQHFDAASIPEPMTLSLLTVVGGFLMARRR